MSRQFNPGLLRHAMSAQQPIFTDDEAGGRNATYTPVQAPPVRVYLEQLTSGRSGMRDDMRAGTLRDLPYFRLVMRYPATTSLYAAITSRWRFVWSSPTLWATPRVFEIKSRPQSIDERRRYLEMTVQEITEQNADSLEDCSWASCQPKSPSTDRYAPRRWPRLF
jgi:hypothetical protein